MKAPSAQQTYDGNGHVKRWRPLACCRNRREPSISTRRRHVAFGGARVAEVVTPVPECSCRFGPVTFLIAHAHASGVRTREPVNIRAANVASRCLGSPIYKRYRKRVDMFFVISDTLFIPNDMVFNFVYAGCDEGGRAATGVAPGPHRIRSHGGRRRGPKKNAVRRRGT